MALKAQKRLLDLEHISEYGSVGRMARRAFIGDIGMLPGEGADELPVAIEAQALLVQCYETAGCLAAMGFVTVSTEHLALRNGMPVGKGKFCPDAVVAAHALLVDLNTLELLLRTLVQLVAVSAADLTQSMITEGPILHIGHGVGAVALETEHGKGRCRQILKWDEFGRITLLISGSIDELRVYGLAAGSVTGLTVYEGHFRPLNLLLSVNTFRQERRRLIVIVARFEASLVAHVISKERAHQHFFILPHGHHRTTGLHGSAGNGQPDRRQDESENGSLTQDIQRQPRHGSFTPF